MSRILKATSLHQPWASAIPLGFKTIETRGHRSHYRGDLAICAAKKWNAEAAHDWAYYVAENGWPAQPPLGCVVAVVELYDVKPTAELQRTISMREENWGNYAPDRFGWLLRNIRPLLEPVPIRGQQGIWTIESLDLQNAIWEQVEAYRSAHGR